MAKSEALVTPRLLGWARERAGLSTEVLAKRVGTSAGRIAAWEAGSSRPTFKQAQKLAASTYAPFGYLFLNNPPFEDRSLAELRTIPNSKPFIHDLSFADQFKAFQFKMGWYREYRKMRGAKPLPFIGKYKQSRETIAIAHEIRKTLKLTWELQDNAKSADEFLSLLVKLSEDAGLWIARSGVVGNNVKRPLDVEVARGFAIPDLLTPFVFINSRDARAAQIFTLIHEIAHLWLGVSAIVGPPIDAFKFDVDSSSESVCNHIAAEVLVPEVILKEYWRKNESLSENISHLSRRFKVSKSVVVYRACDLGLISQKSASELIRAEQEHLQKNARKSKGGGFFQAAKSRNGATFFVDVVSAAQSGEILLRNAGKLLDLSPKNVMVSYEKLKRGEL